MRKRTSGSAGIFIDPFLHYLNPLPEDSFPMEQEESAVRTSSLDSEKICLLIFVSALILVAAISPILCIGSLFFRLSLEGMWYFWIVSLADTGCLVWRFAHRKEKAKQTKPKSLANLNKCHILKLYDISDTPKNLTEIGGMYLAKES